ncbi:MAG: hypothetical protein II349_02840, partial [Akkermansia sp.]|nr:hypothetical protein [Akkermansia sp.]
MRSSSPCGSAAKFPRLCIWSNTSIPAISLQGEGYIPKEHVVQQLKDRFEIVYVLYDNDFNSDINNGRIFGEVLS